MFLERFKLPVSVQSDPVRDPDPDPDPVGGRYAIIQDQPMHVVVIKQ